jgi:hypothetical protein
VSVEGAIILRQFFDKVVTDTRKFTPDEETRKLERELMDFEFFETELSMLEKAETNTTV